MDPTICFFGFFLYFYTLRRSFWMKKHVLKLGILTVALISLVGCGKQGGTKTDNTSQEVTAQKQADKLVRQTEFGPVKGLEEQKTLIWQGIPYGGDTAGENRWKAPTDPKAWTETLATIKPGDIAIQNSAKGVVGSENNLNLDIYRPNNEAKDLPVLIYIHGGNNQTGLAQEVSGASFVENHEAIVVSINYRLGALGFNPLAALKTGTDEENSGNYSLLDINKSLDWVRKNIENFGGNSKNVTVAGFSAGGRDVMALLVSPMFKGKFDKAISLSGGMTIADEKKSQEVFAAAIAPLVVEDQLKATEAEAAAWLLTEEKEVRDYLYQLDASRLSTLMANAGIRMNVFPHLYNDGVVIPKEGFATETYNDVPLMMLTGEQEFSLFARFDPYFAKAVADGSINTDQEKIKQYNFVNKYGGKLYSLFNVEDSAQAMKKNYQGPIYAMEILFGQDEKVVGPEMGTFGSFHGVFVPLFDTANKNYESLIGDGYKSPGAKELSQVFQNYVYEFINDDLSKETQPLEWLEWQAEQKERTLYLDADQEKALVTRGEKTFTYEDVLAEMEADVTLTPEQKEELIKNVLNGRWFSYELDKKYDNVSTFNQK